MTYEEKQKQVEKYSDTLRALADEALIKRSQPSEVIDALKAGAESLEDQGWFWCAKTMIRGAGEIIQSLKHGSWCKQVTRPRSRGVDEIGYYCSECGYFERYTAKYCAGCGARMDGGANAKR